MVYIDVKKIVIEAVAYHAGDLASRSYIVSVALVLFIRPFLVAQNHQAVPSHVHVREVVVMMRFIIVIQDLVLHVQCFASVGVMENMNSELPYFAIRTTLVVDCRVVKITLL